MKLFAFRGSVKYFESSVGLVERWQTNNFLTPALWAKPFPTGKYMVQVGKKNFKN